jgi:protein-tyrosine phosphatase
MVCAMIDLHCHVLPGIDDGPRTIEESMALARAAAAAGTRTIVATPHVSSRYPNRSAEIRERVTQLRSHLRERGIAIELRPGAEVAISSIGELAADELARMTLGSGSWVLLEPPFTPVVTGLDRIVQALQLDGYGIVLAHPERCPAFHREPHFLQALIYAGALTSITAGSLAGRFGRPVRQFATQMLNEGLIHNVASDAHDTRLRPPGVLVELESAGAGALIPWLTQEVPEAILTGQVIPPRPAWVPRPAGRLRQWLRRA